MLYIIKITKRSIAIILNSETNRQTKYIMDFQNA